MSSDGEPGPIMTCRRTLTGQSQSEVSEILSGRRVLNYAVLERIVDGLGIPPELAGLSWHGPDGAYAGAVTVEPAEEVEEMRRRHLLALGGVAVVSQPIKNLGELLAEMPGLSLVPVPSRIGEVHVTRVRDLTQRLREAGRAYGSDPEVSSAAAAWATRLLKVPGTEPVMRTLMAAVAELHLHAGWAAFDASLVDRTMHHYGRALELATEAGDAYLQAVALACAGLATAEHGHPDDGLKLLQFAQVKAWDMPPDHERAKAVEAWAQADSATAFAQLGDLDAAYRELAKSRDLWRPKSTDTLGDLDIVAARLEVGRGRLDAAEPFAEASVRRWPLPWRPGPAPTRMMWPGWPVRSPRPGHERLRNDADTRGERGGCFGQFCCEQLTVHADQLRAHWGGYQRLTADHDQVVVARDSATSASFSAWNHFTTTEVSTTTSTSGVTAGHHARRAPGLLTRRLLRYGIVPGIVRWPLSPRSGPADRARGERPGSAVRSGWSNAAEPLRRSASARRRATTPSPWPYPQCSCAVLPDHLVLWIRMGRAPSEPAAQSATSGPIMNRPLLALRFGRATPRRGAVHMSYRRAHESGEPPPIDPALYWRDDVRAALARHDFSVVYRTLKDEAGLSQRRIADLTGQSQSEVSEILSGRQVLSYAVLERIVGGLGIPPELAGVSWYGPDGTYSGEVTVTEPLEGADLEMLRRHLLALGATAAFGAQVDGIGELVAGLGAPGMPVDLPSRIGTGDVAVIHGYTENLRTLARTHGGQARAAVALTGWADQWLTAEASEAARRALLAALSDLHTITAWCCHDSGGAARSHYHFGRAVELATDAGDGYRAAYALRHAGMMLIHRSEPNDALKSLQLGELRLNVAAPDDPRVPVLQAWCHVVSALALAKLGEATDSTRSQARERLAKAWERWEPPHAHARGDMNLISGLTYLHLGRLDTAEASLAVSARTFRQSGDRREGVQADLTLALVHVRTGEPCGLAMARDAIDAVAMTKSGTARELWLDPLADALDARPGSEARELARSARHLAATRA